MKTFFSTLLFVAAATGLIYAQTQDGIPLPTRETLEFAVEPGSPFLINSTQTYHYYNPDSTVNHDLIDVWQPSTNTWKHQSIYYYSYDANGRVVEKLEKQINFSGTWDDKFRTLYVYYADPAYLGGLPKIATRQSWNAAGSQWVTTEVHTKTAFDASTGVLEGELAESMDDAYFNGVKVFGGLNVYTRMLSINGVRIVSIANSSFMSGTGLYELINREDYIYNSLFSIEYDTIYDYHWDPVLMSWNVFPDQRTIQHISGNERKQLRQNMFSNNGLWINARLTTTEYNDHAQTVIFKGDDWVDSTSAFREAFRVEYTYNPDKSFDKILGYYLDYNNPAAGLYLSSKQTYEYDLFVGTQFPNHQTAVAVYPNPASDQIHVFIENGGNQETRIRLIDQNGRTSEQIRTSDQITPISLLGKPAGVYMLQIEQNGAIKVIPVIKS